MQKLNSELQQRGGLTIDLLAAAQILMQFAWRLFAFEERLVTHQAHLRHQVHIDQMTLSDPQRPQRRARLLRRDVPVAKVHLCNNTQKLGFVFESFVLVGEKGLL